MSPFSFEIQVSHQIQRHLLQSLPAARWLQHCASWRSDDHEEGFGPSTNVTNHANVTDGHTVTRSPAGRSSRRARPQTTPCSEESSPGGDERVGRGNHRTRTIIT